MLVEVPLRGLRDRVLVLRSLPAFGSLDDEDLTLMAEHSRGRSFRTGEVVLKSGEIPPNIYLVLDGQITSRRNGKLLAVVKRPRGVGLLSVMARDSDGVDAVADEPTHTLEIPSSALVDALEESFSLVRNTLRLTASALIHKRGNLPIPPLPAGHAAPVNLGEHFDRPRTLVELVLAVRSGGIFAHCNLDAVIAICRGMEEVRVPAGHVFWRIGDPSAFSLRVQYGCVRCTSADGTSVDIGANFMLGNMDAIAIIPRSYEARSETEFIGYRTQLETILAVLENHFELARDMIGLFSKGVLDTPDRTK